MAEEIAQGLAVADTGPVNYLILIGQIGLLPLLFQRIAIPAAVRDELLAPNAPPEVRIWIADPPPWLVIAESHSPAPAAGLHKGEAAAIALALSLDNPLLLMDDRKGVGAARSQGLRVTGTLGLLDMAAQAGLADFAAATRSLRRTVFRIPEALLDSMLAKYVTGGGNL